MTDSQRTLRLISSQREPVSLHIAMLAPPWIPVPPKGYGGIETVVDVLCEALVARGHDVTLFAAPGSRSRARVNPVLETAHPDTIGSALYESDHVSRAFDAIDDAAAHGRPFDVLHDHSGFTALAMSSRISVPVVHTLHGTLGAENAAFYAYHAQRARLVAISQSQRETAPASVQIDAVVPNPIVVDRWTLCTEKDDYLLWIGRMDPVKGAHRAIEAARLARRPLVLAGPVQPGQAGYFRHHVEPHIDGIRVRYVGEVTGAAKQQLYARAAAVLMPIRWREPFGMVMIEALASGTPVIAFPEGSASEIVIDGRNGMLVDNEAEMARATTQLATIDPRVCRESARSRYDVAITAEGYETVYRRAVRPRPPQRGSERPEHHSETSAAPKHPRRTTHPNIHGGLT